MKHALRLGASAFLLGAALFVTRGDVATAADDVELTPTAQPYAIAAGAPWTATFDVVGDLGPVGTAAATTTTIIIPDSLPPTSPAVPAPDVPVIEANVLAHRVIDTRAGLQATLEGDLPPVVARATVPVVLTGGGTDTSFELNVPTATELATPGALTLARAGIYPVTIELAVGGDVVATHRTFVERLPLRAADDDLPMRVAVVASVTDPGPEPRQTALDDARRAIDGVAAASAALGGSISVLLPPSVVAGLEPSALADLRRELMGAELLAAPAVAVDPSSAVAADQTDTFSGLLREGEDIVGQALPDTPPQRSAWLVPDAVSAAAARVLRDPLGFDLLVFDHDVYDGLEGSIGGFQDPTLAFQVDLDGGSTLPGFVVNPASRWLDPDELDSHAMSGVDGAVTIMATMRVTRSELGADLRRSAVLATPPGVAPDPLVLSTLAGYVGATPDMEQVTLAALPGTTDLQEIGTQGPVAVGLPSRAGVGLTERIERIDVARFNTTGAGSMLLDQSQAEAWDAELDTLVSTALTDAQVDVHLERMSAEAQAIYDCVVAPSPFTFTLTGRSSTLRLNLTNACDDDLRVVVHPTSSKLTFPDGDIARTLTANSVTEVEIEVDSRTNGTSGISVELLTPVGSLPFQPPLVLTARVNALSGLGQVVTGGALLVLISWWYGHFRRRRRVRRAMLGEVDNPPQIGADDVSPDAAEVVVSSAARDGGSDASSPTGSVADP